MRAVAETAVRWRAGVTSFHMALQMAARTLLAGVTIWGLSTLLLVWFWVHHYVPVDPQYFRLWLFSWLFGEVIPLRFLNVPYNGRRYPILSVYVFLSEKIYYHSFPVWFWHYAGWGMVPALLALAVAAYVFAPAVTGGEGEHIRGVTIITARRLGWQLRGDGLELGGVRLPRALETQHIAVTGKSGAGKSNLIRGVLRQIAARQEVGVVLDPDREYLGEFFRPERGDVVLNPLDERCPLWTPWQELRPGYAEPDAEAQAESLFPDPPRQADVGSTPFFRRSSRMLYLSLLKIAEPREPAALVELLNLPRAELKQRLKGTPAEALIDPGAHEQGAGIVATVANTVNPFRYLPSTVATEWSARRWAETRAGWVFLTCEEATRAAVLPLLSLWLDSMVHRLLSTELDRGARERVWIVADELPVLRRQQKIESLLARGRKRGLCVLIGFQGHAAVACDLRPRRGGDLALLSDHQGDPAHRRAGDRRMVQPPDRGAGSSARADRHQYRAARTPRRFHDAAAPRHRTGSNGRRDPEAPCADRLSLCHRSRSRQGGVPLSSTDQPAARLHSAIER